MSEYTTSLPISAANNPFNRIEYYRLELVTAEMDRTTWWKDENRREPANVWWITGPGTNRPATEIEIDLWKQKLECQTTTHSA